MANAAKGAEDFAKAQAGIVTAMGQTLTIIKNVFEQTVELIATNEDLVGTIIELNTEIPKYLEALRATSEELEKWNFTNSDVIKGLNQKRKALRDVTIGGYFKLFDSIVQFIDLKRQEKESLEQGNHEFELLGRRMKIMLGILPGLTTEQGKFNDAQDKAAARTARIEAALNKETSALSKLAEALGEVTQIELEKELLDISAALGEARESTDANSDAFVRYEQIATERMALLQTNIQRLRDGLDVLVVSTDDAGGSVAGFGDKTDDAGDSVDDLGDSVDETGRSLDGLSNSVRNTNSALSAQASQARQTRSELVQLTAVAEALALAEARTALAATQAERGRITGTQGGRDASTGKYTGRFVGNVGTYIVNPDGSLSPAP